MWLQGARGELRIQPSGEVQLCTRAVQEREEESGGESGAGEAQLLLDQLERAAAEPRRFEAALAIQARVTRDWVEIVEILARVRG